MNAQECCHVLPSVLNHAQSSTHPATRRRVHQPPSRLSSTVCTSCDPQIACTCFLSSVEKGLEGSVESWNSHVARNVCLRSAGSHTATKNPSWLLVCSHLCKLLRVASVLLLTGCRQGGTFWLRQVTDFAAPLLCLLRESLWHQSRLPADEMLFHRSYI